MAIATALFLAVCWSFDQLVASSPAIGVLRWLGGISYSLYLIHIAVLSPFSNMANRIIPPSSAAFIATWTLCLLLALGAGWTLNRLVELPVERWRRRAT